MTAEQSNELRTNRWTMWLLMAAIVLATAASFSPVVRNGYINYDDVDYLLGNEMVLGGLTPQGVVWAFQCMDLSYWHPLTWMSHMVDIDVFSEQQPQWMHVESLAIHCLNAALLMGLLVRLAGSLWRSALVGALFALHPQRVESVAWIAERKDVLWVLFALLTLHAYVSWVRRGGLWRYWLTVAMYGLGAMSKPMIVTLPCVMLLLDFWPLRRIKGWSPQPGRDDVHTAITPTSQRSVIGLLMEKLPLFAIVFGICVVTYIAQHQVGAMDPLDHVVLPTRIANTMVAYVMYIRQMIWPAGLAVIYPYPQSLPIWQWLPAGIVIVGMTISAIAWRNKWPHVTVGWLWFIGTLVPVIGLVQVGEQARADRYTYFSMIGLAIVVAWSLPRTWFVGQLGGLATAGVLAWLGMLAWLTNVQTRYWQDSGLLFLHAVQVTDNNPVAHCILGQHLGQLGEIEASEQQLKKALELRPGFVAALSNLALIHASRREYETAVDLCRQAIAGDPSLYLTRYNLGLALRALGRDNEAAIEFREALRIKPNFHEAACILGEILVRQGRASEAVEIVQSTMTMSPDDPRWHVALGRMLMEAGRPRDAVASFEAALRLDPGMGDAQRELERARRQTGDSPLPP